MQSNREKEVRKNLERQEIIVRALSFTEDQSSLEGVCRLNCQAFYSFLLSLFTACSVYTVYVGAIFTHIRPDNSTLTLILSPPMPSTGSGEKTTSASPFLHYSLLPSLVLPYLLLSTFLLAFFLLTFFLHSSFLLTFFLTFLFLLLPSHLLPSLLSDDEFNELLCPFAVVNRELTVGKVYAALMIFDYYKQNRAKRLEQQLGLDFTGTIKVVYGHKKRAQLCHNCF